MVEGSRRFEGSRIPDPGFTGDTGAPAEAVTAALAAYAVDRSRHAETLAALLDSRVLVPVVALLGEVEVDEAGRAHEKSSDMATVLMTARDGRRGLLAFTGTDRLQAWDPAARPVPATLRLAARSAIQDGADALVVDIAGPVVFVVEGDDLTACAAGWHLGRVGDRTVWIRPSPE